MESKFEAKLIGDSLVILMTGEITEQSVLPVVKALKARRMMINLQGLKYINSGGVRNWILWMAHAKELFPEATFQFENFPSSFVKQVASIQGFLPPGSSVNSFYVPYFCPKCDHSIEKLIPKQKDLLKKIAHIPCPQCGEQMEIDAVPEYYLEL